MPLCRCSWLYQCAKPTAQARAASRSAKPLAGNSGRYLAVRNSASAKALMLLYRSRGTGGRDCGLWRGAEITEDLASHVALEAADDLCLALPLRGTSANVVHGGLVSTHTHDDDAVEGCVGLTVATTVKAVPVGLAA